MCFFNDTATTEICTLSLHDALPILTSDQANRALIRSVSAADAERASSPSVRSRSRARTGATTDRKSTRLNSSHANISYAVFCLKKKKNYLHPPLFILNIFSLFYLL